MTLRVPNGINRVGTGLTKTSQHSLLEIVPYVFYITKKSAIYEVSFNWFPNV